MGRRLSEAFGNYRGRRVNLFREAGGERARALLQTLETYGLTLRSICRE